MKFEPLLYYSALSNSQGEVSDFAEYDDEIDNPFMGTYHFLTLEKSDEEIQTVWYDFYTRKYYNSRALLDNVKDIIDDATYIDVCYLLGGRLFIWVISPLKSYLLQNVYVATDIIDINLDDNDSWHIKQETIQHQFDKDEKQLAKQIKLMNSSVDFLFSQYNYRYLLLFDSWNDNNECWQKYDEEYVKVEFDHIEEALYDGTHDKLHDSRLFDYHEAGKPMKLAVRWHIGNSEYSAYFWMEDKYIQAIFDSFYGNHPDTKTDFIIHVDPITNKYQLALFRYGLQEPKIIPEDAYQLIVFKNKFEHFRSENYDQPRGAWIW